MKRIVTFSFSLFMVCATLFMSAPQAVSASSVWPIGSIVENGCDKLHITWKGVPAGQYLAFTFTINGTAIYDDWNGGSAGGTKALFFAPDSQGNVFGSASYPRLTKGDNLQFAIWTTNTTVTGGTKITDYGTFGFTWPFALCGKSISVRAPVIQYNFMDGRCNQEPWQSFAVYPDGKGGWIFYAVDKGVGTYAMHVTKAFMAANPDTGVNHIIAQSDGVQLWRLAGGLLQVHRIGMDGKDYSFNLDHCDGATAPTFPAPVPNTF